MLTMDFAVLAKERAVTRMAKNEVVLTKRSQAERLTIAENLIASVWTDYLGGNIEDNNLQLAVNIQVNVNRIVWKLNALREAEK